MIGFHLRRAHIFGGRLAFGSASARPGGGWISKWTSKLGGVVWISGAREVRPDVCENFGGEIMNYLGGKSRSEKML